ncbi:Asp-tRNA(Asn)/Glu-tRNA(Gln) amidotransferase subunit GatB [Desulfosporosinus sp. PR]|uniref:Asp-tRNA(Asn)/Glu-tRNA(Gln) amidotransferase subunit GatB n=1 Tax=Candidatus Desulfosporosinus nitrosoreducens TaxID=3401928 RepID=UPI0027EC55B3|nr:Asp-tRNA(Asn)/Glu-tRNA(Gln) amidotransferase subunit GatB [Desulfosporosinus sp. PR]MDQ7094419.1 Asp-tRNA(Asn)/Glu-tRNA(Gln) amidotransferase subunit GatB [Desulfosporosinus sp. PR]
MAVADRYEMVCGLEVHVELQTKTKIFCGCTTEFGGEQNTHVCPVCLGMPGTLPVLNREVVNYAIKAGLALNCEIADFSKFDRKNYYYPDLTKNYQTSQYDLPICQKGGLEIEVDGVKKWIGITRAHMEEDAGKLVHSGETITTSNSSSVDYNRAGVPLLEIVSEPDMRSIPEVLAYLEQLVQILEYTEVSDCRLEQGSVRFDVNVSLRPIGSETFGTRTETKNLNSFSSVRRCMEYEVARQAGVLDAGEEVIQETRTWDEGRGVTLALRSKEEAHDYRYFPEPDLVPLVIERKWVERIRRTLPELPAARRVRLQELGLSAYDAAVITQTKAMADYFDQGLACGGEAKSLANWVMGDLTRLLNGNQCQIADSPVSARQLVELLKLIDKGTLSGKIAKTVLEEMYATGKDPEQVVKEKGLAQISDEGALQGIIAEVIAANPQSVEDYRAGKERAIGFLVGQIMKATKGQANPGLVNQLLKEKLAGQ